ncbi:hypothetical protein BSKO_03834 [Bryopsis sp. KO-2023]|nr:hypothetical protein BSKO_03834 [Bryopsis sp. KO-2023]
MSQGEDGKRAVISEEAENCLESSTAPAGPPLHRCDSDESVTGGGRFETSAASSGSDSFDSAADYFSGFQTVFGDEREQEEVQLDEYEKLHIGEVNFHFIRQYVMKRRPILRDKLAFVLGFVHIWSSAYWLGRFPERLHRLFCVKAIILFSLRWFLWKRQKMHYYLFDFCYFANVLLLISLAVFPSSTMLLKICFAFNSGPLAWSIVAFRNSLVYHSLDKVTSLFLHYYPMLVSWTLRWHPDADLVPATSGPDSNVEGAFDLVLQLVVIPFGVYMLWAVLYYLKIFVISSKRIQDRGYDTLYGYMMSNKKSAFSRFVLGYPKKWQPLVYMSTHALLVCVTMILGVIWWKSFELHTLFMTTVILISVWNGANYYFEVFAKRYFAALSSTAKN